MRRGIHRGARLGRRGHGHYRAGGVVSGGPSEPPHARWVAVWLAEAFVAVAIAAPAAATKGPAREFLVVFRAGPQVCAEFCAADRGWRAIDPCDVPMRAAPRFPASGCFYMERPLSPEAHFPCARCRSWVLPDGAWRGRRCLPRHLGKSIHGRRFRRGADRFGIWIALRHGG